ncbi:helix-turn-helix transcriptional regulator [Actinomadura xylanilytica]|uniref:helix-turn-helix transcriptional regulator n=1 Tax=Actinomadura xylanilytica TaxID=887459 RepID=UPI00255A84E8|nr:WYL domain-containing protein [Actinomadura xylanilytica]MDL4776641.1 WYL domain-containing protein [Actinomadura xylanilytica]
MDREDRLLALVAEFRAASPEPLGPRVLAGRLGVSERTVRRDVELLVHGGLPVRPGRGRGYVLAPGPAPAALSEAASLVGPVRDTLAEAVRSRRVVRLAYTGRSGGRTFRDVEAHGLVIAPYAEYLVGWCRLRDAARMFRLDRIGAAFLSGRGAGPRDLDELLAALRVPLPRPPSDAAPPGPRRPGGPSGAGGAAGAVRARAWTLDRVESVRGRLGGVVAEARAGPEGAAALRGVLGHLAEWSRWQVAAVRAAATGEDPVLEGRRPVFPPGFGGDLPYAVRERMIQDAMAVRSLGEVACDLREVLEGAAHWAAGCDEVLWEGPLPDPRPFGPPGPPRPLADLLAGWRGPLAHVEWHLDRLADDRPRPPDGAVEGAGEDEEVWVVDRCPLQV